MKARIVYLIAGLGPGGSERQLYYLLKAMDKEHYRPAVIVWGFNEADIYVAKIRNLGIEIYPIGRELNIMIKLIKLRRLINFIKPEVVHSYSFYTNFYLWLAALGIKVIKVGSIRSEFLGGLAYWPLRYFSALLPRYMISNSQKAAEEIKNATKFFSPPHLFVVANGIDLDEFRFNSPPEQQSACILGIGSLIRPKRWDRIISAAERLKSQGVNFHLKIAGRGHLYRPLAAQISKTGLDKYVSLLGYVSDIPKLLSEASFLVHPSDYEGFPNVVVEAMAAGKAVIATDAGDIPYIIEDGITGFIVKRDDLQGLVEKISRLISNADLRNRLGEAGRLKIEKEFGIKRLLKETLSVYRMAGWKNN